MIKHNLEGYVANLAETYRPCASLPEVASWVCDPSQTHSFSPKPPKSVDMQVRYLAGPPACTGQRCIVLSQYVSPCLRTRPIAVPRLDHQRICRVFEEMSTAAHTAVLHQSERVQGNDVGQRAMSALVYCEAVSAPRCSPPEPERSRSAWKPTTSAPRRAR